MLACVMMVLTAGWTTVLRHRWPSLAHWCDDELVVGPMAVLAHWRDGVSAAGRKAVLTHSLAPSGNGSMDVDVLGPDRDWLDGGSLRGPLLVRPGKGGKIPKSSAGQLATVGAASQVQTRSRPPGRSNIKLLTSHHQADSDKLVGDASSKCKEARGAQDHIIHNGDDNENGGGSRHVQIGAVLPVGNAEMRRW